MTYQIPLSDQEYAVLAAAANQKGDRAQTVPAGQDTASAHIISKKSFLDSPGGGEEAIL